MGPHQMVGANAAQVGSAFCSWVMGSHQLVGAWAPLNGGGPCSSSGLCFLFMGDGPHQLVGASGVASMRQEGEITSS